MANRQRNIQLKIWVNEEERKLIEQKMAQLPTAQLGAYIRKWLLTDISFTPTLKT